MTADREPIDQLLRAALPPHDQPTAQIAATRHAALAALRHEVRSRSWRYRLEAGAMMTAAAAQLVWVVGALFRG
jgi:hypothetical protein